MSEKRLKLQQSSKAIFISITDMAHIGTQVFLWNRNFAKSFTASKKTYLIAKITNFKNKFLLEE